MQAGGEAGKNVIQGTKDVASLVPETIQNDARATWKYMGKKIFKDKGYTLSDKLLNHSLDGNGKTLIFNEKRAADKWATDKIKNTNTYSEEIIPKIQKQIAQGKLQGTLGGVSFRDGDLMRSVHNADVYYKAIPTKEGYKIQVGLGDKYDFHLRVKNYKDNGFLTTGNNAAYFDQRYISSIKPYNVNFLLEDEIKVKKFYGRGK